MMSTQSLGLQSITIPQPQILQDFVSSVVASLKSTAITTMATAVQVLTIMSPDRS